MNLPDNGKITASLEDIDAAVGLINMTAGTNSILGTVTPDHDRRPLSMRDGNANRPLHPTTKVQISACIKTIALLAVNKKLKDRRKYLSLSDYKQIQQMVKRQYGIPSDFEISLKKITRAMKKLDNDPLIDMASTSNEPIQHGHERITKFSLNDAAMLLELPNNQQPSITGKDICAILVSSQKAMNDQVDLISTPNIQKSCIALNNFFRHVFDSQAEVGNAKGDPPIMYCCGATGTGKTMTTNHMVRLARHRTIKKDVAESDSVYYVNCSTLPTTKTSTEAFDHILNKNGINELQFRDRGSPRSLDGCTIIILDEIDFIVGCKGLEGMLQRLLAIASQKQSLLAIVGISNSVYDTKTEKLLKMGIGSNKIVFPTYTKDELIELFRYTVGVDSINSKTVKFVAAKVSHAGGDARTFFRMMHRTIDTTINRLGDNDPNYLFSDYCPEKSAPLTTIHDAMRVFMTDSPQFKISIESLPEFQKQVLLLGTYVEKYLDGKPLTMHMFSTFVRRAQSNEFSHEMTMMEIKNIIEHLQDTGLVKVITDKKQSNRRSKKKLIGPSLPLSPMDFFSSTIRFVHALEDVESAVGEIILENKHYTSLLQRFEKIVSEHV
jgi:hypothetical protein